MPSTPPADAPSVVSVPPPPRAVILIDPDTIGGLIRDIKGLVQTMRDRAEQADIALDNEDEAYLSAATSKAGDLQHYAKMHYAELQRIALHARGLLQDLRFTDQRKVQALEAHIDRARREQDSEELRRLLKRGFQIHPADNESASRDRVQASTHTSMKENTGTSE